MSDNYYFKVRVFEEIFTKRGVRWARLDPKRENICKRPFIDDSNEYNFIHVPSSSSNAKKKFSTREGF